VRVGKLVLPTAVRQLEQTAKSGGWSEFFDAVLASLERDERGVAGAQEETTVADDEVLPRGA